MFSRKEILKGIVGIFLFPGYAHAKSFFFPNVEVFTEQGRSTNISNYYGKPLLLHLWGSYCTPCLQDLPTLVELEKNISVLGLYDLANENVKEAKEKIQRINTQNKIQSQNLLLPRISLEELARVYMQETKSNALSLPTYFLLSSDAQCVYINVGRLLDNKRRRLEKKITQLQ